MSKAFREYKQFLKKYESKLTSYEKKLANIILENFFIIEKTSSAHGTRGKLIANLINKHRDTVVETFSLDNSSQSTDIEEIHRLTSLTVKNFRGFSDEQFFEFKKPYTFVYGPNGSGKSSFCEALEYSLLGTVHEAEAKRINLDQYIRNAFTGHSDFPILKGKDLNHNEVKIKPRPQSNEFYFIERNRIERFSRVSANTNQAQQERLSSLFGLDDFYSFVNNFNEKLDAYLDGEGKHEKELTVEQNKIKSHEQTLESLPKKRSELEEKKARLLSNYQNVDNLEKLKEILSGTEEKDGLINQNLTQIALLESLKRKSDPGIDKFITTIENVDSLIKELHSIKESLQNYKNQMSLTDLYNAILKNQNNFHDKCPACESDLYLEGDLVVPHDPYLNAAKKLKEFQTTIKLEKRVEEIEKQLPEEFSSLKSILVKINSISESTNYPQNQIIDTLNKRVIDSNQDHKYLGETVDSLLNKIHTLNDFKNHLTDYNKKVAQSESEITEIKKENTELRQTLDEISSISADIKSLDSTKIDAKEAIKKFSEDNKELIEKVKNEKAIVKINCQYIEAYISLKSHLEEYNRQLPSVLVSNLSTNTLEFYNSINRYDHPYDRLVDLTLPSNPGEKIKIRFENGTSVDALYVLSEGHIRCLGLAILLAKNVEDNLPMAIFDDIVNAIDDEHRQGIIETLLENKHVKEKQLIITSHGEEFIKNLENRIPYKSYNKMVNRIDFIKAEEPNTINVRLDQPRNYLVLSQQCLDEGRLRDSLAQSRRALEFLINKLWKRLANKYNTSFSVLMRNPGRPPELMSIVNAILKFSKKQRINEYDEIISALETLNGNKEKHPILWNYLNKGTHEENRLEEFNRVAVREMIELLIIIDNNLSRNS